MVELAMLKVEPLSAPSEDFSSGKPPSEDDKRCCAMGDMPAGDENPDNVDANRIFPFDVFSDIDNAVLRMGISPADEKPLPGDDSGDDDGNLDLTGGTF